MSVFRAANLCDVVQAVRYFAYEQAGAPTDGWVIDKLQK